jgi:FecR protein
MKRGLVSFAARLGLFLAGAVAWSQTHTISAKPGVVNYIEGVAYLNGDKLSAHAIRDTFLKTGDELSTDAGKAEVLLSPGVFLRIGDDSQIRMISPSLTETQVAILKGEAIIEAAGLIKGSIIHVTDQNATVTIEKNGLYRFKADDPPSAAVLDGKALVYFGDNKLQLSKNHETILSDNLKSEKFNPKQEDELYAWSNVRSEYDAAASYQSAQS